MPDEHAVLWMPEGTLTVAKTPTGCRVVFTTHKNSSVQVGIPQTEDVAEFAAQLERISRG